MNKINIVSKIILLALIATAPAQGMWNSTKKFVQKHPLATATVTAITAGALYYYWNHNNTQTITHNNEIPHNPDSDSDSDNEQPETQITITCKTTVKNQEDAVNDILGYFDVHGQLPTDIEAIYPLECSCTICNLWNKKLVLRLLKHPLMLSLSDDAISKVTGFLDKDADITNYIMGRRAAINYFMLPYENVHENFLSKTAAEDKFIFIQLIMRLLPHTLLIKHMNNNLSLQELITIQTQLKNKEHDLQRELNKYNQSSFLNVLRRLALAMTSDFTSQDIALITKILIDDNPDELPQDIETLFEALYRYFMNVGLIQYYSSQEKVDAYNNAITNSNSQPINDETIKNYKNKALKWCLTYRSNRKTLNLLLECAYTFRHSEIIEPLESVLNRTHERLSMKKCIDKYFVDVIIYTNQNSDDHE